MISMVPRYKTHPTKTLGWGTLRVFSIVVEIILGVRNVHSKKSYRARRLEPGGQEGAGLDYGGVALGAGGNHADFYLEEVGDKF